MPLVTPRSAAARRPTSSNRLLEVSRFVTAPSPGSRRFRAGTDYRINLIWRRSGRRSAGHHPADRHPFLLVGIGASCPAPPGEAPKGVTFGARPPHTRRVHPCTWAVL